MHLNPQKFQGNRQATPTGSPMAHPRTSDTQAGEPTQQAPDTTFEEFENRGVERQQLPTYPSNGNYLRPAWPTHPTSYRHIHGQYHASQIGQQPLSTTHPTPSGHFHEQYHNSPIGQQPFSPPLTTVPAASIAQQNTYQIGQQYNYQFGQHYTPQIGQQYTPQIGQQPLSTPFTTVPTTQQGTTQQNEQRLTTANTVLSAEKRKFPQQTTAVTNPRIVETESALPKRRRQSIQPAPPPPQPPYPLRQSSLGYDQLITDLGNGGPVSNSDPPPYSTLAPSKSHTVELEQSDRQLLFPQETPQVPLDLTLAEMNEILENWEGMIDASQPSSSRPQDQTQNTTNPSAPSNHTPLQQSASQSTQSANRSSSVSEQLQSPSTLDNAPREEHLTAQQQSMLDDMMAVADRHGQEKLDDEGERAMRLYLASLVRDSHEHTNKELSDWEKESLAKRDEWK